MTVTLILIRCFSLGASLSLEYLYQYLGFLTELMEMIFADRTQKSCSTDAVTVVTAVIDRAILGMNLKKNFYISLTPGA